MNKKMVAQVVLYAGALGLYYFSSPSVLQKMREQKENAPITQAKPVTVAAAESETPILNKESTSTIVGKIPESIATTPPELNQVPTPQPLPQITTPVANIEYIEIINSCGPPFDGDCVNARAGAGTDYDAVARLRNGIVLKVADTVEADGRTWYKIKFDEELRYPERLNSDWYVAADFASPFYSEGVQKIIPGQVVTTLKKIIVDLSEQKIYAYDGDELFMEQKVSTGIPATPTPRGVFSIFRKTPTRYMQGPVPGTSEQYYDLPGVPWDLYFTTDGAVFHGAYWHDEFGHVHSNGCVNLPLDKAEQLYTWADLGTKVIVQD